MFPLKDFQGAGAVFGLQDHIASLLQSRARDHSEDLLIVHHENGLAGTGRHRAHGRHGRRQLHRRIFRDHAWQVNDNPGATSRLALDGDGTRQTVHE